MGGADPAQLSHTNFLPNRYCLAGSGPLESPPPPHVSTNKKPGTQRVGTGLGPHSLGQHLGPKAALVHGRPRGTHLLLNTRLPAKVKVSTVPLCPSIHPASGRSDGTCFTNCGGGRNSRTCSTGQPTAGWAEGYPVLSYGRC